MKTRTTRSWSIVSALLLATLTSNTLPTITAYATPANGNNVNSSKEQRGSDRPDKNRGNSSEARNEKQKAAEQPRVIAANPAPQGDEAEAEESYSPAPVYTQPITSTPQVEAKKENNPAGNNGFIKINEEIAPDSIPNNDPHVPCTFNVEFYNYDANPSYYATVDFKMQAPTNNGHTLKVVKGNVKPFIGQDAAGGGNDLDAFETYQLAFTGQPHQKQGYHVKVTIHADGSRGNDVKHKVFWVQPCESTTSPAAPTTAKPQQKTDQGQTLSQSTVKAPADIKSAIASLPSRLPSTGMAGVALVLAAIAAMAGTYTYVLRRTKRRGLHF